MCIGRRLSPVEKELEIAGIKERLEKRVLYSQYPPRNQPEFSWEEIWIEQVPFFIKHAHQVVPLFEPDGDENDYTLYEDEERFKDAYKLAAKDFALYLITDHEDCPMTWSKPKWVFFIRKLFLQALRHFPRPRRIVPHSTLTSASYLDTNYSSPTVTSASTSSSEGQTRRQAPRSQPRWTCDPKYLVP